MAQTTQQNAQQSNAGKPPMPKANPKDKVAVSKARLQYALDRACVFIHDGRSSYASRAARAARAGVPRDVVERGLTAMVAALEDAKAAVNRAYTAPPTQKSAPKSRATLV